MVLHHSVATPHQLKVRTNSLSLSELGHLSVRFQAGVMPLQEEEMACLSVPKPLTDTSDQGSL